MTRILLLATAVGLMSLACSANEEPAARDTGGGAAASAKQPAAGNSAEKPAAPMSAEEKEVRAAAAGYVEDFDKGDATAVASHFAPDAEHVGEDGTVLRGRDAIQERAKQYLAAHKGAKLDLDIKSVDVLHSGVAIERGVASMTGPNVDKAPENYIAVYAKSGGQWLIQSIQNIAGSPPVAGREEQLSQLDWLIGDWVGQRGDAIIHSSFAWTANKAFITASFSVVNGDKVEIAGTQVIGWDPANGQIHSWVFDSTGAFGEGTWSRDGDRWLVSATGTTEDGRKSSQTGIYTKLEKGFQWQAVDREVEDEMMPDTEPVTMIHDTGAEGAKAAEPSEVGK